jgi:protein-disulfide isomerase
MEGRPCKTCLPAAQLLLKQVQAGRAKKEREDAFHARFDAGNLKTIITDGAPEMGPPNAVVTIVEWADFECPACRAVYPLLDELAHRYPTQVRVVYKFYPLSAHPHGEISARTAAAAFRQGKFWEMHHLLFENQDKLEQPDLERYAKQLNLDLARFRADLGSKEIGELIEKDRKQADGLGLDGTPFLFIGGRYVNLQNVVGLDDLVDWVKLDIELAGQVPQKADDAPVTSVAAKSSASPAVATGAKKK